MILFIRKCVKSFILSYTEQLVEIFFSILKAGDFHIMFFFFLEHLRKYELFIYFKKYQTRMIIWWYNNNNNDNDDDDDDNNMSHDTHEMTSLIVLTEPIKEIICEKQSNSNAPGNRIK